MSDFIVSGNVGGRILKEKLFRYICYLSIIASISCLGILLFSIVSKGFPGFFIYKIEVSNGKIEERFIENDMVSRIAKLELLHGDSWISVSGNVDMFLKNPNEGNLLPEQIQIIRELQSKNLIRKEFNTNFFKFSDSVYPEIAGIKGSLTGTLLVMFVFLVLSFPIGVLTAFYIETYAPKNLLTKIIEINISNLSAVPSIIYGLLGLVLYIQIMDLPRSSALVGGMTISLLVLPYVIIGTRNAIKTVPDSIKTAAMAVGASRMQVIFHHILPLSMPGIITGTILAILRAIGETAPFLMIGMVAFIPDMAGNLFDPAVVLPVQIYLWSDNIEPAFVQKTSAAIMVLLFILFIVNALSILIRRKFTIEYS